MVDLRNVDLLMLQSRYMQGDTVTRAYCAALEPLLHELGGDVDATLIYPCVDCLSGPVLDELAWGLHVDAYDALADDAEKRRMIRASYLVHKYKGTAFAVRTIVGSVFGAAGAVEEWFQYGGEPYHFRMDVVCTNRGISAAEQLRALRLIDAGKNLRSVLDSIQLILSQGVTVRAASCTACGTLLEVYPGKVIDTHNAKIASATAQSAAIEVFEKGS